jgi:hypothetical protein
MPDEKKEQEIFYGDKKKYSANINGVIVESWIYEEFLIMVNEEKKKQDAGNNEQYLKG